MQQKMILKKKLNQAQDIIDPLIEKAESQANLSEYCQNLKKESIMKMIF